MNKFISIFGQILQIFPKGEFYTAIFETRAEQGGYKAPFVEGISLILLSMLVPWSIAFAKALKIASTI